MATPIIALDLATSEQALALVDQLGAAADFYKIGSQLFTAAGPPIVRDLRARGKRVFLDLKFHDIPNTVANAVAAAASLQVDLLTVHVSGGVPMMQAARAAAGAEGPRVLGVTVLTSFGADDVQMTWGREVRSMREEVLRLAGLAAQANLHGIVTSPLEVEPLRRKYGADFIIVTPGIRPAGEGAGDQIRTATPGEAARLGADYLVIGRPVTQAADPLAAMLRVQAELEAGTFA
jgi:orotidine-5'-phosphate decarboxylase